MKRTVIAARDFSIDGISFLPGDEVDVIALGKTNLEFRSLVHSRFLSFGVAGRSFEEVMEKHKKVEVQEEENIPEAQEEQVPVVEENNQVENKRKRR